MSFNKKYKPLTLSDVVYHDDIIRNSIMAYGQGLADKSLILYGPNGTGKTTIANLIPGEMVPGIIAADVRKLNSAKSRSITEIRKIFSFGSTACFTPNCKFHFVILDEVDNLNQAASAALHGIMDDLEDYCIFIMTTNNLHKVSAAIQSRCARFEILPASAQRWLPRAAWIMCQEGYPRHKKALANLLSLTPPDNRKKLEALEDLVIEIKQRSSSTMELIHNNTAACIIPSPFAALTDGSQQDNVTASVVSIQPKI